MAVEDLGLEPTAGDKFHLLIRAGLSSVPIVGSAAEMLFEQLVAAPTSRRRDEWITFLVDGLQEVTAGLAIEERTRLEQDELFLSIALQASAAALKTHEEAKRAALRNCVLNAAAGQNPEEAKAIMFLGWVDQFTEWHLILLAYLADPPAWFASHGRQPPDLMAGARAHALEAAFPDVGRDFYDQVVRDLHARGLLTIESVHGMVSGRGVLDRVASEPGLDFLRFVSAPERRP